MTYNKSRCNPSQSPLTKGGSKGVYHASRITRHAGFTLVELLITMAVFVFVIAAATSLFVPLLTQFKQQSKMSETNIEGVVGLDIMRRDIEHAGYGLPWNIPSGTYSEAVSSTPCGSGTANPSTYNDSTTNPPRGVVSGNNNCTNGSDYLVIKAVNVARNDASKRSTNLKSTSPYVRTWTPDRENVNKTDSDITNPNVLVTVISPGSTTQRTLILNGTSFSTTYSNVTLAPWIPSDNTDTRIVYGVDDGADITALRMPFNRADYYIKTPTSNMPSRCAFGTRVLYKATVNQSNGNLTELPLLDCVADMQVGFGLDQNENGTVNCYTNDLSTSIVKTGGANSQNIRNEVKEIRVYILAHEGQIDRNYTFNNFTPGACATCIRVGDGTPLGGVCETGILGRDFDLSNITDYLNYRWKVYTLVVKPMDLNK